MSEQNAKQKKMEEEMEEVSKLKHRPTSVELPPPQHVLLLSFTSRKRDANGLNVTLCCLNVSSDLSSKVHLSNMFLFVFT